MMFKRAVFYLMIPFFCALLSACGGGGGSGETADNPVENPVVTPTSNWDALMWDQDDWS